MPQLTDFSRGLPDIERALVLAPHPDDESLGCGGTIALYSDKVHFTVVAVSNGEAVAIPEDNKGDLRKKEFEDAIAVLGAKAFICLDIPDGKFKENRDLIRSKFSVLFADKQPQIVFVPSPIDLHPDHVETAHACLQVSREFPSLKIAFYEVYNPIRFNVLIDIGAVIETKKRALLRYHYGMLKKEETFVASNMGLNRSRSLFTLQDSYYEAFWVSQGALTLADVITWVSGGLLLPSAEDRLLDNLRFGDALVHEIRRLEEEIREKERSIEQLALEARGKDDIIASLRGHVRHLETGLFHRLAKKYYGIRDAFFPEGTSRRRLYDSALGALKKDRSHQP